MSSFLGLIKIVCGHSQLNSHQAKFNPNQSVLCKVAIIVLLRLIYIIERQKLEYSVEGILSRKGLICSMVDIKVLSGNITKINKEASIG